MYKHLANVINEYEEKKKTGDEEYINRIIDIVSNQYNLFNYIRKVELSTKKTENEESYYNPADYKLFINNHYIHEDIEPSVEFLKQRTDVRCDIFAYNIMLFAQIMHELDHVLLEKETVEKNTNILHIMSELATDEDKTEKNSIKEIIMSGLRYYYNGFIYEMNHDLAPFERRAEITSLKSVKKVLEELNNTELNKVLISGQNYIYTNTLNATLINPYSLYADGLTNAPSYDYMNLLMLDKKTIPESIKLYNEDEMECFIKDSNDYNYDQRLLYGLQLSEEEYKTLKK